MKSSIVAPLLSLLLIPAVDAATVVDETRPVAPDAMIEVENVAGSVRIRAGQGDRVRVTGTLGDGVKGLIIDGSQKRLRIKVDYPNTSGWGWWGGGRVDDSDIELELPPGVELKAETVSASIEVEGLTGKRIDLESVSGKVTFRGAPEVLEATAVSGDIRVETNGSRDVTLESVSGRVELAGPVSGRLEAESVSGRIRLAPQGTPSSIQASGVSGDIDIQAALAPGGRLSAESLSGSLTVTLPKSTSARLSASSFSGSIRSDVGTVEKEEFGPGSSLKAALGSGDGKIDLESFSGAVRIKIE